jgi:hypothetical protein
MLRRPGKLGATQAELSIDRLVCIDETWVTTNKGRASTREAWNAG